MPMGDRILLTGVDSRGVRDTPPMEGNADLPRWLILGGREGGRERGREGGRKAGREGGREKQEQ